MIHELQKSVRAQGFYKNLAVNIFLGIFAAYMAVILLFLGFSLDEILEKINSSLNPFEMMAGAMLYVLLSGVVFRFFMQRLNTFNLAAYQLLPIKRSGIVNFIFLRQLLGPANYFILLIVVPFALQSVMKYYDAFVTLRLIVFFVLMAWFNSFVVSFLKRKYGSSLLVILIILLFPVFLAFSEYAKFFSLFNFSLKSIKFILLNPFGLLIPFVMVIVALFLNKWFFSQNYYSESFNRRIKETKFYNAELSFLDRFGLIGELIALELRLIIRHKRTKTILYMSVFFLFYGLIFYTNPVYSDQTGLLFFVAMFITGQTMLMYGQWLLSWHSNHFDGLLTLNIPLRQIYNANYYLLLAFNVLCFLLTTPYFYFGSQVMYLHFSAFIYNVGVNIYLLLYFSSFNRKRIDLSNSSTMNYQGTTFKNFLIMIPVMLVPMLVAAIVSLFTSMFVLMFFYVSVGLLGVFFRKPIINLCVSKFYDKKYSLAEGFREAEQ